MSLTPNHIGTDKIYYPCCNSFSGINLDAIDQCQPRVNYIESINIEFVAGKYRVEFNKKYGGGWVELLTAEEIQERIKILR